VDFLVLPSISDVFIKKKSGEKSLKPALFIRGRNEAGCKDQGKDVPNALALSWLNYTRT
jgi:hypothetical protein